MPKALSVRETILKKWGAVKEKNIGYDRKVGYGWSKCSCREAKDDKFSFDGASHLSFFDSQYAWAEMSEAEEKYGEPYDQRQYIVSLKLIPETWRFTVSLESKPDAPSYYDFEPMEAYSGQGYNYFVECLDKLLSGEESEKFGKKEVGIPSLMLGFVKFVNIIKKLPDKFKGDDAQVEEH